MKPVRITSSSARAGRLLPVGDEGRSSHLSGVPGVQRLDHLGDREVSALAELGRVLKLLEGDDVRIGGVDRRDDLVALAGHV